MFNIPAAEQMSNRRLTPHDPPPPTLSPDSPPPGPGTEPPNSVPFFLREGSNGKVSRHYARRLNSDTFVELSTVVRMESYCGMRRIEL